MIRFMTVLLTIGTSMLFASSAQANQQCGTVTQTSGPVVVTHGPCAEQYDSTGGMGVYAQANVRSYAGNSRVESCTMYTKVWRNHTLIVNSAAKCIDYYFDARFYKSWPRTSFPRGTRLTAQTFFDVRYRYLYSSAPAVTKRFTSLRAAITAR